MKHNNSKSQKNLRPKSFKQSRPQKFDGTQRSPRDSQKSTSASDRIFGAQAGTRGEISIPKTWRIVAGSHAINEVIKIRPKAIKELWLKQGWEAVAELKDLHKSLSLNKVNILDKPLALLDRMCFTHQGAVLFVEGAPNLDFEGLGKFEQSIVLALDGVEDPHNLGAILRTSWLMGVHGLLAPEDKAVGLTATVHKVACGGAEHVPFEEVNNLSQSLEALKEEGYWVYGLSHKATKTLFDISFPEKVIWVIGAEDKGMRSTTERVCDELVSIPQLSPDASFNASVAAAIALTETVRQQKRYGAARKKE